MSDYLSIRSNYSMASKRMVVIRGWCIAIIAITSSLAMMHGDTTLVSEQVNRLMGVPNYIASIIFIITILREPKSVQMYKPLAAYIIVGWLLMTFWYYDKLSVSPLLLIVLLLFCCAGERVWLYALERYKWFLLITSAYGVIAYISFFFSLGLPHTSIPYYSSGELMGWTYENYYLALLVLSQDGLRLAGLFNEPGYFGTIVALYLISQKFDLKRKENIVMFVAGCFSFSLAYYVLVILYFSFGILKKPQYVVFVTFVLFALHLSLPYMVKQNEMVGVLLERFSIQDGNIIGNNRTTERFDLFWNQMFREGKALFGYGHGYSAMIEAHSLSWKNYVLEYGFIGAFMMWGLLYRAARNKIIKKDYYEIIFVFLFFASIYQRPSVFWVQYMLILFGGITSLKYNNKTYRNESAYLRS